MVFQGRISRCVLALTTLAAVLVPLTSTKVAAAAGPTYVKTLVGPSVAAMYASGLEWDPIHNRIVVADTGLDRVDFYGLDGTKQGEFGVSGINVGELSSPRDVALDGQGNIYVADAGNNRVEKFDSTGATMAWAVGGTGTCDSCLNTPIGVTWDAQNNVLLVASTGQSLIKAFNPDGTFAWKSPSGSSLDIASPRDVTRGPDGRIWIADYQDHQIAVFNVTASGTGWTPAFRLGDGQANGHGDNQLNFPYNVAFSPDHTIAYVADTGNDRIARWDISGPTPVWLPPIGGRCSDPCPDNSPGLFEHLRRVTVTPDGTVIGSDFWGSAIQVFQPDGTVIRQIEGAAAPLPGTAQAFGVATGPDGSTYVVDRLNQRIERFAPNDTFQNARGSRGVSAGHFSWPEAAAVAPDGTVWMADTRNDRLQHFAADLSGTPAIVGDTGSGVGFFNYPEGLTVDNSGRVWVADTRNDRIERYDPSDQSFATFGSFGSGPGQFDNPEAVVVTADAMYVADTNNNRVEKLTLGGAFVAQSTVSFDLPEGLTVAPDGTVWVADTQHDRLVHLSSNLIDLGDGFGHVGTDNTSFDRPHSLAMRGNQLLVADTYNDRVQIFQTSANPPAPFNPVYSRQISDPGGVAPMYPAGGASDGQGNLYLADSGGSRIVKLDASNNLTTVYQNGLNDPRDLNFDTDGTLWLVDTSNNQVKHITTTGTLLDNFGNGATYQQPYGIALDATGVYVADTYNMRVVKIDKTTGAQLWVQTTCGGTDFSRPRDVGIGPDAQLYVTDTDNDRVAVLDPATGDCLRTFGGTGTTAGKFKSPRAVTADPNGDGVWVADAFNYRVQHLSTTGTPIAATSGGFGEGPNQYRSAHCVFADGARIDVCDTYNYRIQQYTVSNGAPTLAGVIGGTKPTNGGFNGPFDAAYGPSGELYVVDWFNHRIEKFNPDGTFALSWGGYGSTNGSLIFPRGITVSPDGKTVVVTDSENNRIDLFDSNGNFESSVHPTSGAAMNRPYQTAVAADGSLWIADANNDRVLHLSPTGTVLLTLTNGGTIKGPRGIALSSAGNVYVSDTGNNRVEEYGPDGTYYGVIASKGNGPGQVSQPHGLRIANVGGSEKLFVADNNDRIVVLTLAGAPITTFGSTGTGAAHFDTPNGLGVNPVNGDLAVADWGNNRVSIWTTNPVGAPGAPVQVHATPGDHQATLTWSAPTVNAGGLTQYRVHADPGGTDLVVNGSTTQATVPNLVNGVTYTFTLTAANASGEGESSVPVTATPGMAPSAPQAVHATGGKGTATVTWSAPASNGGAALTGYTVTATPGGAHVAVDPSKTAATLTLAAGTYTFSVTATNLIGTGPAASASAVVAPLHTTRTGYWMLGADGSVYGFGNAPVYGSTNYALWAFGASASAIATNADGSGYWVAGRDGTVHAYGKAQVEPFNGVQGALRNGEVVTTIAPTPTSKGYWLFTNLGRVMSYGDARFHGDMRRTPLNGPIVASAATPTGKGYYMVGSDGGIFAFGDAVFHGSMGGVRLNQPVVGISPTPDDRGYWLVASDGGVFAFNAPFRGSMGGVGLQRPVNGLVAFGNGYLMVASDGGVFDFSNQPFLGSLGGRPPAAPVIGIAAYSLTT